MFRRFQIGRLPDGREEWLEFWRANHLLAPFSDLESRSESGEYGGRAVRFFGLGDLIRSKETERASDWQDVALLKEIRDERNIVCAAATGDWLRALDELRSRKGLERLLADPRPSNDMIRAALASTPNPITASLLKPFTPDDVADRRFAGTIGEVLSGPLTKVTPASPRHLALAEAVRRLYKMNAMAADRADKETALRGNPP